MIVVLFKGRGIMSRLIEYQTRGEYSHAALLDERTDILYEAWQFAGVRTKNNWSKLPDNDDTAHLFKFAHSTDEHDGIRNFLSVQIGKSYDWFSVLRFVSKSHLTPEAKEKWFCSELVFAAIRSVGVELFRNTEPWEVSPDMLKRSPYLREYPKALL